MSNSHSKTYILWILYMEMATQCQHSCTPVREYIVYITDSSKTVLWIEKRNAKKAFYRDGNDLKRCCLYPRGACFYLPVSTLYAQINPGPCSSSFSIYIEFWGVFFLIIIPINGAGCAIDFINMSSRRSVPRLTMLILNQKWVKNIHKYWVTPRASQRIILWLIKGTLGVSYSAHRPPCVWTFAVILSFLLYAQTCASFKYLNKVKYAGFEKDLEAKHKEWQKSAKAVFTCSAGTANAFSGFALLLKSLSSSPSPCLFQGLSHSASILRIYFLLEFTPEIIWPSKLLQQTLLNASFNFIIWFLFDIKGFKRRWWNY